MKTSNTIEHENLLLSVPNNKTDMPTIRFTFCETNTQYPHDNNNMLVHQKNV